MNETRIPDRSEEPAVQESLDKGKQSRTAVHSEDAARDAGKGPRGEVSGTKARLASVKQPQTGAGADDSDAKPDDEEVEEMTGVPPTSKELSQM